MRLTLTDEEVTGLRRLLDIGIELDNKIKKNIVQKIIAQEMKVPSIKKINATKNATKKREEQAKNKIVNAVNLMNLENETININKVSKKAGVSYNTVKKYKYLLQYDLTK